MKERNWRFWKRCASFKEIIEVVAVEKSRLKSDDPLARVEKFELGLSLAHVDTCPLVLQRRGLVTTRSCRNVE